MNPSVRFVLAFASGVLTTLLASFAFREATVVVPCVCPPTTHAATVLLPTPQHRRANFFFDGIGSNTRLQGGSRDSALMLPAAGADVAVPGVSDGAVVSAGGDSGPSSRAPEPAATPSTATPPGTLPTGNNGNADCTLRLRNVRYVPTAKFVEATAAMHAALRHEDAIVARWPQFRVRRNDIKHEPSYFEALRELGVFGEPSAMQQSQSHWENRAPDLTGYVQLPTVLSSGGDAASPLKKKRVPPPVVTDRPFNATLALLDAAAALTSSDSSATVGSTMVDVPLSHPVLSPLHGSVTPARLMRQSAYLAKLAGVADYFAVRNSSSTSTSGDSSAPSPPGDLIIIELGAGNGGLLYGMCPTHPRTRCYGTDTAAALITRGNAAFQVLEHARIFMHQSCFAGHLTTGEATAVISHGVMILLNPDQACRHVAEALRLLRPGGRAVFWMLSRKWLGVRMHPSFFIDADPTQERDRDSYGWRRRRGDEEPSTSSAPVVQPLSRCSAELGDLVASVRIIDNSTSAAAGGPSIYPPSERFFGAVLERSAAPWPTALDDAAAQPAARSPPADETFPEATPAAQRRYTAVVQALALLTQSVQIPKKPPRHA